MQVRAMVLCLLALGVVWVAVSAQGALLHVSEPTARAPHGSTGSPPLRESLAAKPACKPCKVRESCGCTHNGKPRTSCDPCCYQGPQDPLPVCID